MGWECSRRKSAHRVVAIRRGWCKLVLVRKSGRKILVKRIVVFMVLVGLSGAWSLPANAQSSGTSKYVIESPAAARKSAKKQQRMFKKSAKKQRKAMKKYAKAQRKAAKRANRRAR
jgi:hypothetical protein